MVSLTSVLGHWLVGPNILLEDIMNISLIIFFFIFLVLYFTLATTYHFLSPKYDNYVCLMSKSILLISYHSIQMGTTSMIN